MKCYAWKRTSDWSLLITFQNSFKKGETITQSVSIKMYHHRNFEKLVQRYPFQYRLAKLIF